MSIMSARRETRRQGQSAEARKGRAYRAMAVKAYRMGDERRAEKMLTMSDYWTARANCNRDKSQAVDGAVINVVLT